MEKRYGIVSIVKIADLIMDVNKKRKKRMDIKKAIEIIYKWERWPGRIRHPPSKEVFEALDVLLYIATDVIVESLKGFDFQRKMKKDEIKIKIVEAGVDSNHQAEYCDHCGKKFESILIEEDGEIFEEYPDMNKTCSHTEYLTLCNKCYRKAGNSVR